MKNKPIIRCPNCHNLNIDYWIHIDKNEKGIAYCFDCEIFFRFKPISKDKKES